MGMRDNKGPNNEKPYGLTRREHMLTPGRGIERFKERNMVTGVESGQNALYPLRKPIVPTKEEVEKRVQQKMAEYEKSKKKK